MRELDSGSPKTELGRPVVQQVLNEYLAELRLQQRPQNTIDGYAGDCRDFFRFLAGERVTGFADITSAHVPSYLQKLSENGYSDATLARRQASLGGFFRWAIKEGQVAEGVLSNIPRIQVDKARAEFKYLTKEEVARLLEAAKNNPRDNAIIRIILTTGARTTEISKLSTTDAVERDGHIVLSVTGARDRRRIVELDEETSNSLLDYRANGKFNYGGPLFHNYRKMDKPLLRSGIWLILQDYIDPTGTAELSPKMLRNTFIIRNRDGGPAALAAQLGIEYYNASVALKRAGRVLPPRGTVWQSV